MKNKRVILLFLLFLEVILISGVTHPILFNSSSFNRAFLEWYENPTPETELRKNQFADRMKREVFIIQTSIWIMLVLNSGLILLMWRKVFIQPPTRDAIPRGGLPGA